MISQETVPPPLLGKLSAIGTLIVAFSPRPGIFPLNLEGDYFSHFPAGGKDRPVGCLGTPRIINASVGKSFPVLWLNLSTGSASYNRFFSKGENLPHGKPTPHNEQNSSGSPRMK